MIVLLSHGVFIRNFSSIEHFSQAGMLTNPEGKTPGRLLVRKIAVWVILCGVIPKD